MPLVLLTVIIAARNATNWLQQCLDSVDDQRLPFGWDLRIMVGIDNCPATLDIACGLRMPRLSVYYFGRHVGPYIIFNSLATRICSDALARFDADDVMLSGYLKAQIALLNHRYSPTITQTWSIYADSSLMPIAAHLADGSCTSVDGRRLRPSDGQFMMTCAVWNRLGGFQPWWCHADTEFMRRARWAGIQRSVVPEHLYLRRVHNSSLTSSKHTGYSSEIRNYYKEQIRVARESYANGIAPPTLSPVVSNSIEVSTCSLL
jgi:glycosyltransferase involved in cell wall biosynthesis